MTAAGPEHSGPSVGPVVLDIGGDVGAAVVVAPERLDGLEIEIRRADEPWAGRHVAVRARPGSDAAVCAAVFPDLRAGAYELRVRGAEPGPVHPVVVRGGEVVWHRWESTCRPVPSRDGHEHRADVQRERGEEHSHAG